MFSKSMLKFVPSFSQKFYLSSLRSIHSTSVCSRYYAEKLARGPLMRKYGKAHKERLHNTGLLPRDPKATQRLPKPIYKPENEWNEEKIKFGQNDYIDILGGFVLQPSQTAYDMPEWLRGVAENEYQMLIRNRKLVGESMMDHQPSQFRLNEKRIQYLYRRLNFFRSKDEFVL